MTADPYISVISTEGLTEEALSISPDNRVRLYVPSAHLSPEGAELMTAALNSPMVQQWRRRMTAVS